MRAGKMTIGWGRTVAIAFSLGAVYGLLALEAVSPLAIDIVIWVALILACAWRLPPTIPILCQAAVGFLAGFSAVQVAVLGHQLQTCLPPSCQTADPFTDLLYGIAFTVPVIAFAAREIVLRPPSLKR